MLGPYELAVQYLRCPNFLSTAAAGMLSRASHTWCVVTQDQKESLGTLEAYLHCA